jgi:hypothetical protein
MIQTEMSRRPLSSPRARCEVVMQGVIGEAPLERQAQAGSSKPSSFPEHGIHDLPRSRPQVALR